MCLCFSKKNHAPILPYKNAPSFTKTCFMVKTGWARHFHHNVALIGAWTDKNEWGRTHFGWEKGNKLHLGINLFFVRYFPQILSCFFPYIHYFIFPSLKLNQNILIYMANGNQNPNGIYMASDNQNPNLTPKNQIIFNIYQNLYPKFTCSMETKTPINS